ncbi:excisionase family DNA-binding protein [Priestia megaterium]|nr:excisionase family DNA-binding protein [Priestia megaterium]MED4797372.1 excisionase family DNA-binding protein [Priestia megaterium]
MYITIKEAAQYQTFPEEYVKKLIKEAKIPAIFDGENYLLNKEQFNTHLEQMEKYKKQIEEYLNEPIPEDMDVKDED